MAKKNIILSLIAGFIAVAAVIGFSSFDGKRGKPDNRPTDFYWYVVDYSVPQGRIPSGASPVFSGNRLTQADAQANDGCQDVPNQKHCLRGFSSIPTLPTESYESSTPKPNN